MTKTIMMFLAFLLVLPILPWLPLNISLKGKLIIAVESFAIAASAVLLAPFLPLWQNVLLAFLFCAVAGYFTLKYGLPGWSNAYAHEEEGSFEEKAAVMALPKKRPAFSALMPGRKLKQSTHTGEEEQPQKEPVFFEQAAEKAAASQIALDPPASNAEKAPMSAKEKSVADVKDEEDLTELSFKAPAAQEVQKETKPADELDFAWEEELPEVSFEQTEDQKTNNEKEALEPQPENSSFDFLLEDDDIISSLPEKPYDEKRETDDDELELLFADEAVAQQDEQTNLPSNKNEEPTGPSLYSAEEDSGENLISTVLEEDALAEIAPEKTASAEESEPQSPIDFEAPAGTAETVQSKENQKAEFEDLEELDLSWIDSEEEESTETSGSELKLHFEELEALDLEDASSHAEAKEEIKVETKEISELTLVENAEEIEEGLDELDFSELAQPELASTASDKELKEETALDMDAVESHEDIEELQELDFEETADSEPASTLFSETAEEDAQPKELLELDAAESLEDIEELLQELDFEETADSEPASTLSSETAEEDAQPKELLELDAVENLEEAEEMSYELDFGDIAEPAPAAADFDKEKKAEVELKELSEPDAGESTAETEEIVYELDFEEQGSIEPSSTSAAEKPKEESEWKNSSEPVAGESAKEIEEIVYELDFEEPVSDSSTEESVPFDLDELVFEEENKQEPIGKEGFENPASALKENKLMEQDELAEAGTETLSFNEKSSNTDLVDSDEAEKEMEAAFEELAQLNLEELAFDTNNFEELEIPEAIGPGFENEAKQDSKEVTAEEESRKENPEINEEFPKEAESFILPELAYKENKTDQQKEESAISLTDVAADENQNLISAVFKEEALAEPAADEASSLNEQSEVPAEFKEANQLAAKPAEKERVRLSSDWLSLITKEISVKQTMLPFEEAEQTILRYLNAPLHERDYYVIARMLLVFYIGQGEKQKAELLAEKLIQQFKEYPLLIEELKIMQAMLQN